MRQTTIKAGGCQVFRSTQSPHTGQQLPADSSGALPPVAKVSGNAAIKVYAAQVRKRPMWVVDGRSIGEGRRFFVGKHAAEAEAVRLRTTARGYGKLWTKLTAPEKHRLASAYLQAESGGHDLAALVRDASASPGSGAGPKLSTVITDLLEAKRKAGRDEGYVKNLEIILNQFAVGRQSIPINRLDVSEVEAFLDAKTLASRSTLRARLSSLFKFAIRRGYRLDNPCARLEPVTYHKPPPSTFTVKQFKAALRWLRKNAKHGLAWFILSTGCGLRPEEAEKSTQGDINFDEGFIRVEKQTTKVRQRRVVYPKKEALAWLKWALKNGGRLPLHPKTRRRMLKRLRVELGFKAWPRDITRHSAASYWLALEPVAHVSKMLGHSEKVCERDYKALKTRAEAEEFWRIRP